MEPTDINNPFNLAKGTAKTNPLMYNSWALFGDNLPVGATLIGDYSNQIENGAWCTFKFAGRLYIFMANSSSDNISITLSFSNTKKFKGKLYNLLHCGDAVKSKFGNKITFKIPAYSGLFWIEDDLISSDGFEQGAYNNNGTINVFSNSYISDKFNSVKPSTSYRFSQSSSTGTSVTIVEFNDKKDFIKRYNAGGSSGFKFTTSETTNFIKIQYNVNSTITKDKLIGWFKYYTIEEIIEDTYE